MNRSGDFAMRDVDRSPYESRMAKGMFMEAKPRPTIVVDHALISG
jgi:hypothetical protein